MNKIVVFYKPRINYGEVISIVNGFCNKPELIFHNMDNITTINHNSRFYCSYYSHPIYKYSNNTVKCILHDDISFSKEFIIKTELFEKMIKYLQYIED